MNPSRAYHVGLDQGRRLRASLPGLRGGHVVAIYDDLSWEREPTPRDYRRYLHGVAVGLYPDGPAYLVIVGGGNGHNEYRLVAGYPPRRPCNGGRQRRTARTRQMQAARWAMRGYEWMDREARAVCRAAGRTDWDDQVRARQAVLLRAEHGWGRYEHGQTRPTPAEVFGEP